MFLTEIGHDRHESGAHKKRRVAVIVFGEVLSYDESDAESGLMLAVRQALPRELERHGRFPGHSLRGFGRFAV